MAKLVEANRGDPFYEQVGLIGAQMEGLRLGQNALARDSKGKVKPLTDLEVWMLNSADDISDIAEHFAA